MKAGTVARPEPANASRSSRRASVAFIGGLLVLAALFGAEIEAAARVWITSTAYNHCLLVIPIACFLAWDRRATLRELVPQPLPWAALLALPLAAAWLFAERLGVMEGRQLVLISLLQVSAVTVYGWQAWRSMAAPLLYLFFLVPFGEFLVPVLQAITTGFVRFGLLVFHIPAFVDGNVIEIPEGIFFIAEACAGLRFLIASVAFGYLYAALMYRSPGRRVGFILASILVPIVANGCRALGMVSLGHFAGSAQAVAADHVLYGWIFFSLVTLLLIALGLPFRQDRQQFLPARRPILPASATVPATGVALLLLLAAAGPLTARTVDRTGPGTVVFPRTLDLGPGCETRAAPELAAADGAGMMLQRVVCDGRNYELRVARLPPRSTGARLIAAERQLTQAGSAGETMATAIHGHGDDPVAWQLIQSTEASDAVASAIWVDARPAAPNLTTRFRMARNSLCGGESAPIVLALRPVADWHRMDAIARREAVTALVRFLETEQVISRQMQSLAAALH